MTEYNLAEISDMLVRQEITRKFLASIDNVKFYAVELDIEKENVLKRAITVNTLEEFSIAFKDNAIHSIYVPKSSGLGIESFRPAIRKLSEKTIFMEQ